MHSPRWVPQRNESRILMIWNDRPETWHIDVHLLFRPGTDERGDILFGGRVQGHDYLMIHVLDRDYINAESLTLYGHTNNLRLPLGCRGFETRIPPLPDAVTISALLPKICPLYA